MFGILLGTSGLITTVTVYPSNNVFMLGILSGTSGPDYYSNCLRLLC